MDETKVAYAVNAQAQYIHTLFLEFSLYETPLYTTEFQALTAPFLSTQTQNAAVDGPSFYGTFDNLLPNLTDLLWSKLRRKRQDMRRILDDYASQFYAALTDTDVLLLPLDDNTFTQIAQECIEYKLKRILGREITHLAGLFFLPEAITDALGGYLPVARFEGISISITPDAVLQGYQKLFKLINVPVTWHTDTSTHTLYITIGDHQIAIPHMDVRYDFVEGSYELHGHCVHIAQVYNHTIIRLCDGDDMMIVSRQAAAEISPFFLMPSDPRFSLFYPPQSYDLDGSTSAYAHLRRRSD